MLQEKLPIANHICEVCGTKYYACNKCIELMHKGIYGWKLTCCTRSCFQMKMFYNSYKSGEFDKQQALAFIETLSLPVPEENLNEDYACFIREIKDVSETTIT